jgi:hypothetical protein
MKQLDKGNEIVHTFETQVIDDKLRKHIVHITQGKLLKSQERFNGLILSIEDTPGAWYIETLYTFHGEDSLNWERHSIWGNWECINWREVMNELKDYVKKNNL